MYMKRCLINLIATVVSLILLSACDNSHTVIGQASSGVDTSYILNPNPDPALFANAQSAFNSKCLNCHNGTISSVINLTNVIQDGFVIQGPASQGVLFRCVNTTNCISRNGLAAGNMISLGSLTAQEASDILDYLEDIYIQP